MMKTLATLSFLLTTSSALAALFGVDDRISIRPGAPGYALSRSTAVALLSSNFETTAPGKIRLNVDMLDQFFCPKVKFAKQTSLQYACTGFLVAPDIIMTAGHCMVNTGESRNETEVYCKAFSWLFDYNDTIDPENVDANKLYGCKRVIYAVKDEKAPFRDFALVQLNRAVKGRTPFKLNSGGLKANETLSMIGHPFGLPSKLSRNAKVLINNPKRQSFLTNLDAFHGNSGSPVLNSKNEVIGILVGGTPSANTVTNGSCEVLNRCSERGTKCLEPDKDTSLFPGYQGVGSEVQRIGTAMIEMSER
jgi:V8-like Glu-specific endopeptidase